MKELIQRVCAVYGPTGNEDRVAELIRDEVAPYADEVRRDRMGNLLAIKHGRGGEGALKVLLAAHMDEIGVIVTAVDEKGFLRCAPVGGVNTMSVIGARCEFADGTIGTFSVEPDEAMFMRGGPAARSMPTWDKIFLDTGATSKAGQKIRVGDVASFHHEFAELNDRRLLAPNFDDRIACAIQIQALRELKDTPHEAIFAFTVQEEIGTRGATTVAFGIEPDVAIAVDVTGSGDTPHARPMDVALGKGCAIKVKDGGMIATPWVKDWMVRTAEQHNIPYQLEVLLGGSTDARAIQTTLAGIPSGCLSIPSRYIHTPSQIVDYDDVLNCVRLLKACLEGPIALK